MKNQKLTSKKQNLNQNEKPKIKKKKVSNKNQNRSNQKVKLKNKTKVKNKNGQWPLWASLHVWFIVMFARGAFCKRFQYGDQGHQDIIAF